MEHMRHHALSILKLLAATSVVLFFSSQTVNAQPVYSWAVVPQFSDTTIHGDWTPLINIIEKETGHKFKMKFYSTITRFERGFLEGEPDFAYMNPYHAVMAKDAQGYTPIIRDGGRQLVGILVVRNDSAINTISDLNGTTISFPSPNAFASSLYLRTLLHEKEKINFKTQYSGTHSNSYRHVLGKQTAASGGVKRTLQKERKEVQDILKVIYQTPGNPSHPLTAHPRVPDEVRIAVQRVLLDIARTEEGHKILKRVLLPKPIEADYNRDYLPLKDLKIDKYFVAE